MKNCFSDLVSRLFSVEIGEIKKEASRSFAHITEGAAELADMVIELMFPERSHSVGSTEKAAELATEVYRLLSDLLTSLGFDGETVASAVFAALPDVKMLLAKDVGMIYRGDPAAVSPLEVLLCYPGFYAIAVHRLAHLLYLRGVPYLPRMMTEYAHSKTGIDIHPGAKIGSGFSIDHGTVWLSVRLPR